MNIIDTRWLLNSSKS